MVHTLLNFYSTKDMIHGIKRLPDQSQRVDHLYQIPITERKDDPALVPDRFYQHHPDHPAGATGWIYNLGARAMFMFLKNRNTPPIPMESERYESLSGPSPLAEKKSKIYRLPLRALWKGAGDTAKKKRPFIKITIRVPKLFAYWITVNYREAYGCMRQRNFQS
jgi:hypothetical protein